MVSVIVPNYNYARYLPERMESILNQTYQDFEIILLDDCSTDNSRDVLLRYKDNPRVSHILFNEVNSGSTFVQWEKGFSLAKGEYIWIAESDDLALPTLLEKCVSYLDMDKGISMAFTSSVNIDANGGLMASTPEFPINLKCANGILDGSLFAEKCMLSHNHIYNASMVVFRKCAIKGVSPEYKRMRYCGDYLFWFDIMRNHKIARIAQPLNKFRQHSNKVTVEGSKNAKRYVEEAQVRAYFLSKLNLSKARLRYYRGRYSKRLPKDCVIAAMVIDACPELYGGSWRDILFYEIVKCLKLEI